MIGLALAIGILAVGGLLIMCEYEDAWARLGNVEDVFVMAVAGAVIYSMFCGPAVLYGLVSQGGGIAVSAALMFTRGMAGRGPWIIRSSILAWGSGLMCYGLVRVVRYVMNRRPTEKLPVRGRGHRSWVGFTLRHIIGPVVLFLAIWAAWGLPAIVDRFG
jgi:hypothetical protein